MRVKKVGGQGSAWVLGSRLVAVVGVACGDDQGGLYVWRGGLEAPLLEGSCAVWWW